MLKTLAVSNYRSLRSVVVSLDELNVVTGPNGSGKSNLYRAIRLLAAAGRGSLVSQLAREGGLPSTLWAGPEKIGSAVRSGRHPVEGTIRQDSVHLRLGFSSDDFGYSVDLGLPTPIKPPSAFFLDPAIKRECIWAGPTFRPASVLADRRGPSLRLSDETGAWQAYPHPLATFDSMMTEYVDLRGAPEIVNIRSRLQSWRFYDYFRSDLQAPVRSPQIGTHTPILSNDGTDLAAALQTIREIGDDDELDRAVDDAFPGSRVEINSSGARFELALRQPGMLRALTAAELSDGTLRYVLLIAALLSPRPPELLVLNEPETSLHADLVPALARLIARAARSSQIIVVSHNEVLISQLAASRSLRRIRLSKELGETLTSDPPLDRPAWAWPSR